MADVADDDIASLVSASVAAAEGQESALDENDEADRSRQGFAAGVSLMGIQISGLGGVEEVGGPGGGLALRVGTSAGRNLWWMLQLHSATDPQKRGPSTNRASVINLHTSVTLGAQLYLQEAFWLRAGAGLASVLIPETQFVSGEEKAGISFAGAGGYDIFRPGSVSLSIELNVIVNTYPGDGATVGLGLGASANWF